MPDDDCDVHLEIYGVKALALFIALIRGDNDIDTILSKLTAQLDRSTLDLAQAEDPAEQMSTIGATR